MTNLNPHDLCPGCGAKEGPGGFRFVSAPGGGLWACDCGALWREPFWVKDDAVERATGRTLKIVTVWGVNYEDEEEPGDRGGGIGSEDLLCEERLRPSQSIDWLLKKLAVEEGYDDFVVRIHLTGDES